MNSTRRFIVKCSLISAAALLSGFLKPLLAFAARNQQAFAAKTEPDAIAAFFPDQNIETSDAIKIGSYSLVENGAVVPVTITTTLPSVTSITILVQKNPNPLIASFNLSPECTPFIATRIKVAEPSDIVAVVNSNNKLYSTRKFVEVIEGGCS